MIRNRRMQRRAGLLTIVLAAGLLTMTGCEEEVRNEFRSAAATSLQSGFNSILTGIVDGVFAVLDPSDDGGAGTGTDPAATGS